MSPATFDTIGPILVIALVVVALGVLFGHVVPKAVHVDHASDSACLPYAKIGVVQQRERYLVVCAAPDGGAEVREFTP